MRKIILLRHADTEWESPSGNDLTRPLTDKGLTQGHSAGVILHERRLIPELIVTSSALRTKQTMEQVIHGLGSGLPHTPHHEEDPFLYNCGVDELINKIADTNIGVKTLLVINHNPTIHQLALLMAEHHIHIGNAPHRERITGSFPPCTLCIYDVDIDDWNDFDPKLCQLRHSELVL